MVLLRNCILIALLTVSASGEELTRFTIEEPVGQTWTDEWLTQDIQFNLGNKEIPPIQLQLEKESGEVLPAQFYHKNDKNMLEKHQALSGAQSLTVLFKATIPKNKTTTFLLTDERNDVRNGPMIQVEMSGSRIHITNGVYGIEFNTENKRLFHAIYDGEGNKLPGTIQWPSDCKVRGIKSKFIEKGPARVLFKRSFTFHNPDYFYDITFDIRSGDPWLDIQDEYRMGKGTHLAYDLREMNADYVYHPYTYNARTFKAGGPEEDSTLQPPQHPIATLGPIWRDIWFNGGPYAFVYNTHSSYGVGFAAVRGSEWHTPEGITPESQNLEIHGDREKEGQVRVKIPTDGGKRRWAMIIGPKEIRKSMSRMVRSHADIPLDKVLDQWIVEWESDARRVNNGWAKTYVSSHFNKHSFNPTTFPRRVRRSIPEEGPVYSPDLAILAYIFNNPNYWPGPDYKWGIGNPNFHTDMYGIPLRIALVMPDHPHAEHWLQKGLKETKGDLMRNSYPGGAWQESLSYSAYFFHVAEHARLLKGSGIIDPFNAWPRLKDVATYLAAMHTPIDPRYGQRKVAPIGDTSPKDYIDELHELSQAYHGVDDRFAQQLKQFPSNWDGSLDLSSREFPGFGAMLRGNGYDHRHESFVTIKAGPARNHYQRDELSFYFASLGTPLAIDYACHYSPRPWSAAIHNRPDADNMSPLAVAKPLAYKTSECADVFVAEESTNQMRQVPIRPHYTDKPGWEYPTITLPEDETWTMRRYIMLVKHDPIESQIPDYLVLCDEIDSPKPVWWNLHVLARNIIQKKGAFYFPGQLDVDLTAYFINNDISNNEKRVWGWRNFDSGDRRTLKREEYEAKFFGAIIPEDFTYGTWDQNDQQSGEMAKWLRVKGKAGKSQWLVVLMPHLKETDPPLVQGRGKNSVEIKLGDEHEIIQLGTETRFPAAIERDGTRQVLLRKGELK